VLVEDGLIREVIPHGAAAPRAAALEAALTLDGGRLAPGGAVLMPALVDLHAHFRESAASAEAAGGAVPKEAVPGEAPPAETLESASLAAVAGGFGTVVCMANTKPPMDTPEAVAVLRARAVALALIDLYPAMALTKGMAGRELSGITDLAAPPPFLRLLSEDGRDVAEDGLFLAAFREARRLGLPVSCHCDAGGPLAKAAKQAGAGREVWSRIEENEATRRAIDLGRRAGCHLHIAHVSTREAVALIREVKAELGSPGADGFARDHHGFTLTCEAAPHHLALTREAALELGAESWGRVNPPLREEADRRALREALRDGTIDAIATDHAPHRAADKEQGAPGFSGLETAFALCRTELVREGGISLSRLSALMSAAPARILGLGEGSGRRGRIAPGFRADLAVADPDAPWTVLPEAFRSRGKNSPLMGRELRGRILLTLREGRIVFDGGVYV
jgi:dihydroorotase